jgi:large subunit ribosomal protein L25
MYSEGSSMTDVLNVAVRDEKGTSAARRLRRDGKLPAVLYGHGEENVSLAVDAHELDAVIRHGGKLVDLHGGVTQTALIREVQWDAFGTQVLHLDFTRVSAQERVEMSVPVELRGEAEGLKQGGIVEQLVHDLTVECPAAAIPERISIRIADLGVGQSITVADIELPENVTIVNAAETAVVHCVAAAVEPEEEEAAASEAGAEPEVIGRKAEESEEGEG